MLASANGESAMLASVNRARLEEGRLPLVTNEGLNLLALQEASRVATTPEGQIDGQTIQHQSGLRHVTTVLGRLKNRGPSTGGNYVEYWMKQGKEKALLLDHWDRAGVGTVQDSSGDMVGVLILAN